MATTAAPVGRPASTPAVPGRRVSAFLHRYAGARLAGLLAGPLGWLAVAYLGSLALLLAAAFWTTNDFTGAIVHTFTLDNFKALVTQGIYGKIIGRTVGIALGVTVVDLLLSLPMAYYMAKVASPTARRLLTVAVLTPLWSNYLVKAYAWRIMLSNGGLVDWVVRPFGLTNPGFSTVSTAITLGYLWLPYMVLPIFAGMERLPDSMVEASGDLGARPWRTFRSVILPLSKPAIIAGCITTFSLSLGDYIAVQIVGGGTQMIGNVIYSNVGTANNLPFAAALAVVPVVIMVAVLAGARRTGALSEL